MTRMAAGAQTRIAQSDQKKLFGKSGNRCAYPDCRKALVAAAAKPGEVVVLGEIAHIVGDRENGPRGKSPMSAAERNRYPNLILLCSRHHQIVDAEPGKYTVELLLRFKEDHEGWVEKRMGPFDQDTVPLPQVVDTVYTTLFPIEQMPLWLFGAPCQLEPADINVRLGHLRDGEMAPFVTRGGKVFAFQDLTKLDNPFAVAANPLEAMRIDPNTFWDDPDKSRWYADLLSRTLNKVTGRRGLYLDKEHHRFYFPQLKPGEAREITYRPLNQSVTSRQVVWQPKKKSTGEPRPYWFHRAIGLRFIRIGARSWSLAVRPELRVTTDGQTPLEPRRVGGRVTRRKSRWFNYDLLGELQFWRDYLSEGRPRLVLDFGGPPQRLLISMNFSSCSVEWPGIPDEFVKTFKNVDYIDDLFSWAEANAEADQEVDDFDEQELDEDF